MPSGKRARQMRRELGQRDLRRATERRVDAASRGAWQVLELVEEGPTGEVFRNAVYEVNRLKLDPTGARAERAEDLDDGLWLVVRRLDRQPVRSWSDLQRIKNQLCGEEREACELFPAESRLVDVGNNYHVFVLPAGQRFPWGATRRTVSPPIAA